MCVVCSAKYVTVGAALTFATATTPLATTVSTDDSKKTFVTELQTLQELPEVVASVSVPEIGEPAWLQEQKAAAAARQQQSATAVVVTYTVATRGVTTAGMAEFRSQVNETLNDARGWSRLGVTFQEVEAGGMFSLVLSSADQMTSFSSGCSPLWSCRVGVNVIINQDRWLGASDAWNQAGGSIRDYRHSVVNHEVGHWLGHGHSMCGGPGQPAKIMQQQSIDLQGCVISSWPLASELWSTQLGIDRR